MHAQRAEIHAAHDGGGAVQLVTVVTLALPFRVDLPVPRIVEVHLVVLVAQELAAQLPELPVPHQRIERAQAWRQRRRVAVEIDEDDAVPHLDAQRWQRNAAAIEARALAHMRCATQAAAEVVAPAVVGTDEGTSTMAAALRHEHAAVPADGHERDDLPGSGPHDQQRLATDGQREVITDLRELLRASDREPLAIPYGLQLEIVK